MFLLIICTQCLKARIALFFQGCLVVSLIPASNVHVSVMIVNFFGRETSSLYFTQIFIYNV